MISSLDSGKFDESSFLAFLASNVSSGLGDRIHSCGALRMEKAKTSYDFLLPLRSGTFPRNDVRAYRWVLGEIVASLPNYTTSEWRYDTIYLCSFYLFASLTTDAGPVELTPPACLMLVEACRKEPAARAHVTSFLQWMSGIVKDAEKRDFNPIPFILTGLSILVLETLDEWTALSIDICRARRDINDDTEKFLTQSMSVKTSALWKEAGQRLFEPNASLHEINRRLKMLFEIRHA